VLFVSLFFFPHFLKKEKLLGTFAVVFSIVAVVLYGKFWTWHAGWTFGSRFLIPALPFLALPLVFFVDSFRGLTPVRKIVALCIIGGSIFIQVQHAAVDPLEYNQELKNFILPQESPLFFYPQLSTIHGAGYLIEDGKTTLFISGVIGGWVSQWYLLFYVFFLFVLGWTFRRLCRITLVTLNFKEWYKNSKDWLQGNQIIVVWIVVCILVLCCAYMVRTPRGLACTEREAGTICVERIAKHLRMLQPPSPVGYSCYLQGYLEAPIDGTYQFHLKVNGTYRIMLGGEALFFNDKDIARHLQTNRVDMTQALYPVEIFYESFPERDVVASLYWTLPGEGKLFQPVETEYLYLVKPSGVQKTGDQLWRHWWLIVIVGILPLCVVEFKKRDEAASSID